MKKILNKLIKEEKGQALILALILLAVGGLIIAPLLGFMSTGLMAGQVHEKKMHELYAADAGVELALWQLGPGGLKVSPPGTSVGLPPFVMNQKTTNVNIMNLREIREGMFTVTTYKITSTAVGTTIEAYVEVGGAWFTALGLPIEPGNFVLGRDRERRRNLYRAGDVTLREGAGIVREADVRVYAGGNMTLHRYAEIVAEDGSVYVYVGGNMTLHDDAVIVADEEGSVYVFVGGNVTLHYDAVIAAYEDGSVYVYVGGNMTLHPDAVIAAEEEGNVTIHVWGDLTIGDDAVIVAEEGRVLICVHGNVTLGDDVEITGTFHVAGTVTIGAGAKIRGNIYIKHIDNLIIRPGGAHVGEVRSYGECPCCPPPLGGIGKIVTWNIPIN